MTEKKTARNSTERDWLLRLHLLADNKGNDERLNIVEDITKDIDKNDENVFTEE